MKAITLIAPVLALVLSGCAALDIKTRGLPSCSGIDRRPLNSDLWSWNETNPTPGQNPAQPAPLSFMPLEETADTTISRHMHGKQPRWNIEASYEPCEGP